MSIVGEGNPLADGHIGAVDPAAVWRNELERLDPRSHAYTVMAQTLLELGIDAPPPQADHDEASLSAPPGFVGACAVDHEVVIPVDQFAVTVPLLRRRLQRRPTIAVGGTMLTTDGGRQVQLVDLRPELAASLDGIGPDEADGERLTFRFFHDLRTYLDRGWASDKVTRDKGPAGPCYTRVVGKKARAYWTPVSVREYGGVHVLTVARVADCGNDPQAEVRLYRRLFGMTLRHIN